MYRYTIEIVYDSCILPYVLLPLSSTLETPDTPLTTIEAPVTPPTEVPISMIFVPPSMILTPPSSTIEAPDTTLTAMEGPVTPSSGAPPS